MDDPVIVGAVVLSVVVVGAVVWLAAWFGYRRMTVPARANQAEATSAEASAEQARRDRAAELTAWRGRLGAWPDGGA